MSADGLKKIELEKRYGRNQLMKMANMLLDDQYLRENAKKCPNCNAFIQKTEGCNKMTCLKYVIYIFNLISIYGGNYIIPCSQNQLYNINCNNLLTGATRISVIYVNLDCPKTILMAIIVKNPVDVTISYLKE